MISIGNNDIVLPKLIAETWEQEDIAGKKSDGPKNTRT